MTTTHTPRIAIVPRPHNQKIKPSSQTPARSVTPSSIIPKSKQSNDVKKPIESPISIDHQINNVDKIPKISKTKVIGITLGIIVGIAAIAGLGIGLYTVIQNSKTATATTSTSSEWTWCSTGTTLAGTGITGYQANQLSNPSHLTFGSDGAFYIADTSNHRISKWTSGVSTGTVVAGQAFAQSGSNLSLFNQPYSVSIDSTGKMYVADTNNHRVMLWNNSATSGSIIAGTGTLGTAANQLWRPIGTTLDKNSNKLYISDCNNHRIVAVDLSTTTSTVVFGATGGGSSSVHLYYPSHIYFDSSTKSLYIANTDVHTIVQWVIGATSWILVAGSVSSNGLSSVALSSPGGMTLDTAGNLYVADTNNHRIQFFRSGSSVGTTIVGSAGIPGTTSSLLRNPRSVAVDSNFNVYVIDTNNHRLQMFQRC